MDPLARVMSRSSFAPGVITRFCLPRASRADPSATEPIWLRFDHYVISVGDTRRTCRPLLWLANVASDSHRKADSSGFWKKPPWRARTTAVVKRVYRASYRNAVVMRDRDPQSPPRLPPRKRGEIPSPVNIKQSAGNGYCDHGDGVGTVTRARKVRSATFVGHCERKHQEGQSSRGGAIHR